MKQLKWGIYYAAVIVAGIIAARVFSGHLNITFYSVMPVFYVAVPVIMFCSEDSPFYSSRRERNIAPIYEDGVKRWVSYDPETVMDRIISLVVWGPVPLCLPFVLFFSNKVKMLSFLGLLAPFLLLCAVALVMLIWGACNAPREIKSQKHAEQKELEEQKRREEMGKWK